MTGLGDLPACADEGRNEEFCIEGRERGLSCRRVGSMSCWALHFHSSDGFLSLQCRHCMGALGQSPSIVPLRLTVAPYAFKK